MVRQQLRFAWRFVALAAVLCFAADAGWAADGLQADRFLFVFDSSPVVKKHLPDIQQTLAKLFASNLQSEIHDGDDLAVWTVDEKLNRGSFPMVSWSPEEAAMYTARLDDFLSKQNYTRHASLGMMQPSLNEVVKSSDHLTIVIFCDSKSRLLGTPYDDSVAGVITNVVAKANGAQVPLVVVLRSNRGEYVGSSVNVPGTLNFPAFPPSPKPAPAPVARVVRVQPPPPAASTVAPLIIVGTHAGTNIDELTKLAAQSTPIATPRQTAPVVVAGGAAANAPGASPVVQKAPPVPDAPAPMPAPATIVAPPVNPGPSPAPAAALNPQPQVPAPVSQVTSRLEPAAAPAPVPVAMASRPAAPTTNVVIAEAASVPSGPASQWLLIAGGAALAVAGGLVVWLVMRSRRPPTSLITSSMQNDLRLPPGN